ncbi:MAG: hypothetical protein GF349_02540 [Candidatus Magasanikbacteria bacterium]|nr:hypothetical protein [Candidatus Magasanikbacteria bacterium]
MYWLAKYKKLLSIAFALVMGLMVAVPASAQLTCEDSDDPFCLNPIEESTSLGTENLQVTISRVINIALSLLGIIAVVIILIGGFQWMTAGGNDEKVANARKIIFAGIIGLAIILSAWAIARFVLVQLGQATGVEGSESYDL